MKNRWYQYNLSIALSSNSEEASCVELFSEHIFTEKELKEIVVRHFEDNKEELIFKPYGESGLIDSLTLCKLIERDNPYLSRSTDTCFVDFGKLEVLE